MAHQRRRGDELDHWRGDLVAHWGIMKELLYLISEEREMSRIIRGRCGGLGNKKGAIVAHQRIRRGDEVAHYRIIKGAIVAHQRIRRGDEGFINE